MHTDRTQVMLGAALLVLSGAILLHSGAVDATLSLALVTSGAVGLAIGTTLGRRSAVRAR